MSRIGKAIRKHPWAFIAGLLCLIVELVLATLWYRGSTGIDRYEPALLIFGLLTAAFFTAFSIPSRHELFGGKRDEKPDIDDHQRPFVILESAPRTHSGNLMGFKMKNIGDGAALNISVGNEPDSAIIPFLATGETCQLRIETAFYQGSPRLDLVGNDYNLLLEPPSARDTVVFTIRFQNIHLQPYFVEERIAASEWEIIRSGRVEDRDV